MAEADPMVRESSFVVPERPVATWIGHQEVEESDTLAPLIFDAWYVIALSKEVGRSLQSIKALGEPLVYYRTEDGTPVVLDDRCAHRRFPLSKGTLKGDSIQCGYHGFTYAKSGQCVWAPGLPVASDPKAGLKFGVRSYPCAEKGPWLWVWMGDPKNADPANIPLPDDLDQEPERTVHGYKMNPANYMLLIENLLDLSHLIFLHGAAEVSYLSTLPEELPPPPNGVAWKKVVERTESGFLATLCGDDPTRVVRLEDEGRQFGPSLSSGYQRRFSLPGESDHPRPGVLTVTHAMTPIDRSNTHQFFMVNTSEPFGDDAAKILYDAQEIVFEQDVDAVRDMQAYIDTDARPNRVEFSMLFDRNGLKMRKILKEMKARELGG